ncbi:MAG: hypothetical protein FWH07_03135, partial [Oscillospiraceae bacterium]|nr:hypothetical protein [Oscillospiraceae bacterium]
MKKRVLSAVILFSMLASIFIGDTALFGIGKTEVSASGTEPSEDARRLRVQILHTTGTVTATDFGNIVGCSRIESDGREYPMQIPAGGNIVLRVVNNRNEPVPGATIHFTTSDTNTNGASGADAGPDMPTSGPLRFVPLGAKAIPESYANVASNEWGIPNRVFDRHAGGVTPRSYQWAAAAGPRGAKSVPIPAEGHIAIPVPARATASAIEAYTGGYPNRSNPSSGTNLWEGTTWAQYATHAGNPAANLIPEGDRDMFVVSAIATPPAGSTDYLESHPITRSFFLGGFPAARLTNWRTNDFLIFSIYADSRDLFDHYVGVTVPGVDREEWIRNYRARNPANLQGGRPWQSGEMVARTRPDFVDYTI